MHLHQLVTVAIERVKFVLDVAEIPQRRRLHAQVETHACPKINQRASVRRARVSGLGQGTGVSGLG